MATTLAMTMVSCSKDDDVNNGNEIQTDYVWGTDGSIKTCDHLTFTADGKDDANGTIIGNGDKEFGRRGNSPWIAPPPNQIS